MFLLASGKARHAHHLQGDGGIPPGENILGQRQIVPQDALVRPENAVVAQNGIKGTDPGKIPASVPLERF